MWTRLPHSLNWGPGAEGAGRVGLGGLWSPTLSLGSAPLKGSRQRGHGARLLGSSGKADLGQQQPGRGTSDSLSHILQGEIPAVCVACWKGLQPWLLP